ncbi:hypothetical protein SADUNF_Sadunf15G0092900 [Salix dunnii]|uniref:Uncharacterized protein n=1 Tax=Salix dunnii TaxID=1413687 RepID=A0A835JCS6_9ROSI|nr:hypothetical protein SADUNF_Sadunf15G0092900 [Salix dunnii]
MTEARGACNGGRRCEGKHHMHVKHRCESCREHNDGLYHGQVWGGGAYEMCKLSVRCRVVSCFYGFRVCDRLEFGGRRRVPEEARELEKEVRQITKEKDEAVRGQDFEKVQIASFSCFPIV